MVAFILDTVKLCKQHVLSGDVGYFVIEKYTSRKCLKGSFYD